MKCEHELFIVYLSVCLNGTALFSFNWCANTVHKCFDLLASVGRPPLASPVLPTDNQQIDLNPSPSPNPETNLNYNPNPSHYYSCDAKPEPKY